MHRNSARINLEAELYKTAMDASIESKIVVSYRHCILCKPAVRLSKHQVLANFFMHK